MVSPRKENSWMVDILLKILGVPQPLQCLEEVSPDSILHGTKPIKRTQPTHLHAQSVTGLKKCHGLRFQCRQAVRQEHRRYGRYSRHRINFFDTPALTTPSGPFESPRLQGPVFFQMTLVAFPCAPGLLSFHEP